MFYKCLFAVGALGVGLGILGCGGGGAQSRVQPEEPAVAVQAANVEDRDLYLTPGGKYTAEDIQANGHVTAPEKFQGFKASHDLKPLAGERICPVTLTKANSNCTWIIDGQTYLFCCPPCIDEFVKLAKEQPAELKAPEFYVKG